ncbi:MAG: phage holin family protein [Candidatus Eremiobacteraeota bacterium]|nr:phage holin family protein [Candidatus Eremiobacteraeota bacterium]
MAGEFEDSGLRESTIGELLKRLSRETTLLVRQEIELAKTELTEKGKQAGKGAGMFGAAGIVGFLALGAFTAFVILLLISLSVQPWLAALIVTIAYGAAGGILALTGKKKLQEASPLAPEQTVQTVKEDVQWAKTQVKSAGK